MTATNVELPTTLSPSRMDLFLKCQLAFKYRHVDDLGDPPTVATEGGTVVHSALELLMAADPDRRADKTFRRQCLDDALALWFADVPEADREHLDVDAVVDRATKAFREYFRHENPSTVSPLGLEDRFEVDLGPVTLRGIIDRLDGPLERSVIVDYKSGSAPKPQYAQQRMLGVKLYAVAQRRRSGVAPVEVRLLYLGERSGVIAVPVTDRALDVTEQKILAVWDLIVKAYTDDRWVPKPSPLCNWCAFADHCPAVNNG